MALDFIFAFKPFRFAAERRALRRAIPGTTFLCLLCLAVSPARGVSPARIVVPDVLCLPGEEVHLRASLYRGSVAGLFKPEIQGEVLHFEDERGNTLDDRLTDAAGMARIPLRPKHAGRVAVTVSLMENPRYHSEPSPGFVFVRNPDLPLFFVLIEGGLMLRQPLSFLWKQKDKAEPLAGSVEKAREICRGSVLVYLSILPQSYLQKMRQWLDEQEYPSAPLLSLGFSDLDLLQKEKEPSLEPVEALWKDRTRPACLVTGDPALARTAAGKGLRVLLVGPEREQSGSYRETAAEKDRETAAGKDRETAAEKDRITVVEGWDQIPSGCRALHAGGPGRNRSTPSVDNGAGRGSESGGKSP